MRVFDLVEGCEMDLPKDVESGRYRMLGEVILNDDIELRAGSVLWSPGVSRCDLLTRGSEVAESHSFLGTIPGHEEDQNLVDRAVQAVIDEIERGGPLVRPSPVMPGKLKEQAELTELEQRLMKDAPHLFNIDQSPRMSMRYDNELMPTARAQRMATGALVRLASHSEDWNRRDFKGVVPKRLLAEVSEDEFRIYENVVYARLLDQLYVQLRRRVRDLRALEARRTDAAEIGNAEHLDFRLRNRLCDLWGGAYSQDDDSSNAGADVLVQLTALLKKVARLRLGRLYQAIPRVAHVPLALRTTNVLLHDQNYKRMRPLWTMAHATSSAQAKPGRLHVEAAERRYQQFRKYVRLLIDHALHASKLLTYVTEHAEHKFGDWELSCVELATGELQLELPSDVFGKASPLIFVPVWRGVGEWLSGGSERQVVFCHAAQSVAEDDLHWGTGEDAVLNPLQFYSVERVKARIDGWMLARLASVYPKLVSPWPQASIEALRTEFPGVFSVEGRGLRALKPVPLRDQERLDSLIRASKASEGAMSSMRAALQIAKLMSTCKACGDEAAPRKIQADSQAFKAVCECGFSWKWVFEGNATRRQGAYAYGDEPRSFEVVGSDELAVAIASGRGL